MNSVFKTDYIIREFNLSIKILKMSTFKLLNFVVLVIMFLGYKVSAPTNRELCLREIHDFFPHPGAFEIAKYAMKYISTGTNFEGSARGYYMLIGEYLNEDSIMSSEDFCAKRTRRDRLLYRYINRQLCKLAIYSKFPRAKIDILKFAFYETNLSYLHFYDDLETVREYFMSILESFTLNDMQNLCNEEIHKVFKINLENREHQKEYLDYAIRYLRYINNGELLEHITDLPPHEEMPAYLLYDSYSGEGDVVNNEYAYKYFTLLADYCDISKIPISPDYCFQFQVGYNLDNYLDCQHAILYYDLGGEDQYATVRHALQNIVILDITSKNYYNPNFFIPVYIIYAEMYMDELIKKIKIYENAMPWPEQFCRENYN